MSEQTKPAPRKTESASASSAVVAELPGTTGCGWTRVGKRLLACNPFYLGSAVLLLFGLSRVSVDPYFLRTELAQLVFNFSALQSYEVLLVLTAIVLARRAVWYDATLLLVLENLLVLVPFMLVSQAAFMTTDMVWTFCLLAVLWVVVRAGAARRFVYGLTPSPRLGGGALAMLLVNAAWPLLYRHLHEFKVGTKPTSGAAFDLNEASWLWLLPTLCALTSLLPHPRNDGKPPVQRRWFPVTLFLCWMLGSAVHLYSLGYVYDFAVRRELLAPALCVLAWVIHLRLGDFLVAPARPVRTIVLLLPAAASLLAADGGGNHIFLALSLLNALAYSSVALLDSGNRVARRCLLLTGALGLAALARTWVGHTFGTLTDWTVLTAMFGLVFGAMASRSPKLGIAGAVALATFVGLLPVRDPALIHWAAQAGLVYFLLHSLRWRDYEHEGAVTVRTVTAIAWILHSLVWVRHDAPYWQPPGVAALVVTLCWLQWWIRQKRLPIIIPLAATLVAVLIPLNMLLAALLATPVGLVAVGGSFLLFGLGTWAAVTKPRWLPSKATQRG